MNLKIEHIFYLRRLRAIFFNFTFLPFLGETHISTLNNAVYNKETITLTFSQVKKIEYCQTHLLSLLSPCPSLLQKVTTILNFMVNISLLFKRSL